MYVFKFFFSKTEAGHVLKMFLQFWLISASRSYRLGSYKKKTCIHLNKDVNGRGFGTIRTITPRMMHHVLVKAMLSMLENTMKETLRELKGIPWRWVRFAVMLSSSCHFGC